MCNTNNLICLIVNSTDFQIGSPLTGVSCCPVIGSVTGVIQIVIINIFNYDSGRCSTNGSICVVEVVTSNSYNLKYSTI